MRKSLVKVQNRSQSVESEDDDETLSYKEFLSLKSAVGSLTCMIILKNIIIDCKYHLNALKKNCINKF